MALGSHALLALATLALLHSSPFFNLHSNPRNRLTPDAKSGSNRFLAVVGLAHAQNDGGGDQSGMEQTDDPLQNDPNMLNPQNKQGYGKNIPTQVLNKKDKNSGKKGANGGKAANKTKSIGEQTFQAALQLGVLVRIRARVFFVVYSALNGESEMRY